MLERAGYLKEILSFSNVCDSSVLRFWLPVHNVLCTGLYMCAAVFLLLLCAALCYSAGCA
jgi:hypothetical protein